MSAYVNPAHGYTHIQEEITPHKSEYKYTLFCQGTALVSWDDLPVLRKALPQLTQGRGTFIRYNEKGQEEFREYGPLPVEKDLIDEYDYDYH